MWIRCRIVQYVNSKISEEYNYLHLHCGSGGGCVIQIISNLPAKQYGISLQKTIMFILTAMNISVSLTHMFNLCQQNSADTMILASCTRRMSDSIEKRFCFDITSDDRYELTYGFIFHYLPLLYMCNKCINPLVLKVSGS